MLQTSVLKTVKQNRNTTYKKGFADSPGTGDYSENLEDNQQD